MILFVFAFLLYLAGFVGVLADEPIELWLWFLAFGYVLDFCLILLAWLGSEKLSLVNTVRTPAKIAHYLVFPLAVLAVYFRLRPEISWFYLVLGAILILWAYSLFDLNNIWRRQIRNE
jgi:uncharacterized membrane protein